MYQSIIWLNMIAFAAISASVGLLYLAYARNPRRWLLLFILYSVSYAVWLLFGTYSYFQAAFLPDAPDSLELIFGYARVGISFFVLVLGSGFLLRIAVQPWKKKASWVTFTGAAVIAVLVVLFLVFGVPIAGSISTITFNIYFSGLFMFALFRLAGCSDARRRMRPYLLFSSIAYAVLASLSVLVASGAMGLLGLIPLNVFAVGLFTLGTGTIAFIIGLRWVTARASAGGAHSSSGPPPASFLEDYAISPREGEILTVLTTGKTSKEIGSELFISQRTVEAHIQNIYRKCNVSNRVELLNLLARYR